MRLFHPTGKVKGSIQLPASKSESNRWLILQALSDNRVKIENLSAARDTQLLLQALRSDALVADVKDAGTTMRFLAAYYCAKRLHRVLKGTARMHHRPIGDLVQALMQLGFRINYLRETGFPPIECIPVNEQKIWNEVSVSGAVSSQFISALLLIAPALPKGLHLHLQNGLTSESYVGLTLHCLKIAGIDVKETEDGWNIMPQEISAITIKIGSDWSAASYAYAIAALANEASLTLPGLDRHSLQGDRVIAEWAAAFGIKTNEGATDLQIQKTKSVLPERIRINFRSNPDVAMTWMVICAALNIELECSGVESLRVKETDRIAAMQKELAKVNVSLNEQQPGVFVLSGKFQLKPETSFETYDDHRMAMALAPLALLAPIRIAHPEVVQKSFPDFFLQLQHLGFIIE